MFHKPMLAKKANCKGVPVGTYLYEVKWDGIRAIIEIKDNNITIYSRSGRDITRQFPELIGEFPDITYCKSAIFDAEIVVMKEGVASFPDVTSRLHLKDIGDIKQAVERDPVTARVFDVLRVDGEDLTDSDLIDRKVVLAQTFFETTHWKFSRVYKDGEKLYKVQEEAGAEGVIAKKKYSKYLPGRRTKDWLKVKIMYEEEVNVVGFTAGKGKRSHVFGALIIEDLFGNPIGNVGTGFTDNELEEYQDLFDDIGYTLGDKYFKLRRKLKAKVKGMKKNKSGSIREPRFVGFI